MERKDGEKARLKDVQMEGMKINVKGQIYNFDFTLKNHKFQQAKKTIKIDQWIRIKGQKIRLDDLIVTPIDQIITVSVGEKITITP